MIKLNKGLSFSTACFATMLFMSSCSKDDVKTPQPEITSENADANMRGGVLNALPGIPKTDGVTGFDVYASGWERRYFSVPDLKQYTPTGTSNLLSLWGDPALPWIKKLPPTSTPGSILTVMSQYGISSQGGSYSSVKTKIKHLKPGKKYELTFQVSTTSRILSGKATPYAPLVHVSLNNIETYTDLNQMHYEISLIGKEAQWVTKTIEFKAIGTESEFTFDCSGGLAGNHYKYANIFVGENAVKEIN